MSKVIRKVEGRQLAHIVQTDDKKFHYVDSNNTFDCGYETMSFSCDKTGEKIKWGGEYTEHHYSHESMKKRHDYIINHLEEVLQNG